MDKTPKNLTIVPPLKVDGKEVQPIKAIGSGTFGIVKICKHIRTGQFIAMKQLNKIQIIKNKQVDHLKNELTVLSSLCSPFVVQFFGYSQNACHFNIYMELVQGGELFHFLREKGKLNWSHACFYAGQIVLMFEYLHSNNVIYRDLKPENLLICPDGYLKITDFGFAKILPPGHKTYTLCGTPEYISPEVLANKGHDKGADWWTLGVLIYELLAGIDPFSSDSPSKIYKKILSLNYSFPSSFSSESKSIVRRLLEPNLTKRYGCMKNGNNNKLLMILKCILSFRF